MVLIEPKVELITNEDPLKKIELAGRTCYKSEDKITNDSAVKFFDALVKRQHTAMLEHATFVFQTTEKIYNEAKQCQFLNATITNLNKVVPRFLVSGNLRAINDSTIMPLIECLKNEGPYDGKLAYAHVSDSHWASDDIINTHLVQIDNIDGLTPGEFSAHKYTTIRFITDRGVTHELVRHRLFSFAQESTRYVTYTKEQFGGGNIKFIKPADFDQWNIKMQKTFLHFLEDAESIYTRLILDGATAQQARAVLPNAVKTEIVVTGNDKEWQHFFNLRSIGTTGAPHPDMKLVADIAKKIYDNNIIIHFKNSKK